MGAIAQLGERYNGIVEVIGSIPIGSTNSMKGLAGNRQALPVLSQHCVGTEGRRPHRQRAADVTGFCNSLGALRL
jgi:hypothetical protein